MSDWERRARELAPLVGGLNAMVALASRIEMDVLPISCLVEIQRARDEVRGLQCRYQSAARANPPLRAQIQERDE